MTPERIGPRQIIAVSSSGVRRFELTTSIAERVRSAVEALQIPLLDSRGSLRVTASLGVAASSDGSKDALIAAADAALYTAKRQGKNRTVSATSAAAGVVGAE